MSDDDWETADIDAALSKPAPVAAAPAQVFETKGEAIRAKINGPDMSQFEDEDKDFQAPPVHHVPAPQPKKKEEKKFREERGAVIDDTPLDDPVAEKLRRQKLVEQADYEAARELFGDTLKPLDSYMPKTVKEFEDFASEIVGRHVTSHADNKNFKAFLKALVKLAVEPIGPDEVKDLETCLAGVRADKIKKQKAAEEEKKKNKKTLNMGRQGLTAGLDDYVYDEPLDNDDDFM